MVKPTLIGALRRYDAGSVTKVAQKSGALLVPSGESCEVSQLGGAVTTSVCTTVLDQIRHHGVSDLGVSDHRAISYRQQRGDSSHLGTCR